jgi:salicylate 5-hydroxylase small subunit
VADFQALFEATAFNAEYAACLDEGRLEEWPSFFTEDGVYRIQARENFDRKLPLSILWLEGRGMLTDRIYAVRETLYHDPYYQRHILSAPRVIADEGDLLRVEANYLVVRTKRDQFSQISSAGRYIDTLQRTGDGLRIKSRLCVFDSELIRNSIIYPL